MHGSIFWEIFHASVHLMYPFGENMQCIKRNKNRRNFNVEQYVHIGFLLVFCSKFCEKCVRIIGLSSTNRTQNIKHKMGNLQLLLKYTNVALSDPDSTKFQQWLGTFHMDWRTTIHANGLITLLQECLFLVNCQKTICMHGYSPIHVNRSFKSIKSRVQICPILLSRKITFPYRLENNQACKWILDNFPGIIWMSAFLENCQKSICMRGSSPIHVKGLNHFLEFYWVQIWECNLPKRTSVIILSMPHWSI